MKEMLSRFANRHAWAEIAAITAVLSFTVSAHQRETDPRQPAERRFALLVGVTEFISPAMKRHNLQGPENDVALFRSLLTSDSFGVTADAIVSLAGLPVDEAARPTRSNIEREFRRLRDKARPGDHVVVLLAGHGSQQPADPDPSDAEPDGLDEIFLPADATGWDRASSRVINAIVDDEIRQWIGAIRNTGAVVSLIVDACHAGTMSRAAGSSLRERTIPAEALIPVEALASAREKVEARSIGSTVESRQIFDVGSDEADIAALYAADTIETTPELPMPDRNGSVHGLFTYTLTRVLSEQAYPMTYRELVQRVIDRYRADGFGPTPAFEGSGVDREVLGGRTARDRSTFLLGAQAGSNRWVLNAGSIHGVTRGSILEVFDQKPGAERLGHVRVIDLHPTESVVEPVAYGKLRAPSAALMRSGSRARIRHHEFGDLRIRIAISPAVERAVRSLETLSQGLAERVTSGADWFLRVTETKRVVLTPATRGPNANERQTGSPLKAEKDFDVGALGDADLPNLLADRLKRIARVRNLGRLSAYVDPEAGLQVGVMRYRGTALSAEPLLSASGDPIVKAGQHLQFVVRNTGTVPLDVTVLYVDANFGIWPLFPKANSELDNRIEPGRNRALDAVEIIADPVGWESVVAIGVEASPRHENFRLLAQDALADARGALDGPPSPLRMLLESAMYGTRASDGNPGDDRGRFAIAQTWFRVAP